MYLRSSDQFVGTGTRHSSSKDIWSWYFRSSRPFCKWTTDMSHRVTYFLRNFRVIRFWDIYLEVRRFYWNQENLGPAAAEQVAGGFGSNVVAYYCYWKFIICFRNLMNWCLCQWYLVINFFFWTNLSKYLILQWQMLRFNKFWMISLQRGE